MLIAIFNEPKSERSFYGGICELVHYVILIIFAKLENECNLKLLVAEN